MANRYTLQKIDMPKAIRFYESGMTQIEVAKQLNTTQKVICMRFKKIGYKCRIAKKRNQYGSLNHMWKGKDASYCAKHYRVYKLKGTPKKCEVCLTTNINKWYDWANLTGDYDDPKDYKRMCRKCHREYDKKHFGNVGNNQFSKGGDASL